MSRRAISSPIVAVVAVIALAPLFACSNYLINFGMLML